MEQTNRENVASIPVFLLMCPMTVDEIRSKFNTPTDKYSPYSAGYCVLGAAIMYKHDAIPEKTMWEIRFPGSFTAARELDISYTIASYITDLNDAGEFENAWSVLDHALRG